MKKIIYRFLITLVVLIFGGIIFLSTVGIKTDKFNSKITEQTKKVNKDLKIKLNDVMITLDPLKFKFIVKTFGTNLILKDKKIQLKSIKTNISIISLFNRNFSLSDLVISTKPLEINNLASFLRLLKNDPKIYIAEKLIKKGYVVSDIKLYFDRFGNIKDNYQVSGIVKDGRINFLKKYDFKNIDFNFKIKNKNFEFADLKLFLNEKKFYSPKLSIINIKDKYSFFGKINNDDLILLAKDLENFIKIDSINSNIKKVNFNSENNFQFSLDKNFKLKELNIESDISINNLELKNIMSLNKIFPDEKKNISLKDHKVKLSFKEDNLEINGYGDIFFQKELDKIKYKIKKNKNILSFDLNLIITKNPFHLNFLNYKKDRDDKLEFIILGNKSLLSNEINLKNISIKEKNNKFEVKNLSLSKKYKIKSLSRVNLSYFDNDLLKNELSIQKKDKDYLLDSKSLNATKIIDDLLKADKNSDNKKIFSNNFKLNIKIKEALLDKDHLIKNLDGYLIFKDSDVIDANLVGDFSDNQKLNFTIRSTSNEKITTLYSDLAKPFINRYKFIKGFEEGNLDFHSVKQNNVSNSKLIIDNFKVQEVPALAKLLTLASLQGIADLLTGEGIRFTDFEMKFSNKKELMKIEELYAIGPAISLLMEGYIESDDLISLRGTMVPATTINRTISSIPLIGDILVGKKVGEGVFGVSFKIKGPPNKLKTTVNPVKTLTPRFITRTLEKIKNN